MKLREKKKRETGSALLVVLGFLSFMVVSAVAFAIYMRSERVPSSALRRNTATRHLVKAALAQAMSRVDDAIRNDPFPGLANTNGNVFVNFYHDKDNNSMDLWFGRVFMPPDPAGLIDDSGARVSAANEPEDREKFSWRFAPVTETVSVLNLEALGYLPPPLVNDVRFLSRSSFAAKWQNFAFDAGRFAFCAVNVSDYFDINRTKVGVRSSPLDSRISLRGTLTWHPEDGTEETVSDGEFTELGKMLGPDATRQTYSNPDGNAGSGAKATTEYISMLDYNLALGSKAPSGIGPVYSPFYNWIKKGSESYFYGGSINTSTGAKQARRQPFVTDSFEPQLPGGGVTNGAYGKGIDLATYKGQPFYGLDMRGNATEQDVLEATSSECFRRMYEKGLIGRPDLFTLYDYLDHDDVPLSLAMPSVECVPMVAAVDLIGNNLARLQVNPTPQVEKSLSSSAPGPAEQTTKTSYNLKHDSFDTASTYVRVLVAYPFRHFNGRNVDGFKVQVAMKVFVAAGAVSVRPADGLSSLHPDPQSKGAEWDQQSKAFTIDGKAPGNALAWSLYSEKIPVSIPNECDSPDKAVISVKIDGRWKGSADMPGEPTFFTMIEKEQGTVDAYGAFHGGGKKEQSCQFNLRPFNDGTLLPNDPIPVAAGSPVPYSTAQFRTYAMLWVRIVDADGKTVDLAPAIMADDQLNSKQNNLGVLGEYGGNAPGCLLFSTDPENAYTYENLLKGTFDGLNGSDPKWRAGTGSDANMKSLATVDPRYNYAPEDWFVWDKRINDGTEWLDEICGTDYFKIDMQDGGTRDIFMFTSNQGYLQSPGEFAFLPRLSQWNDHPGTTISSILKQAPKASAEAKHADGPMGILNLNCAWRTYPVDRTLYEDFVKVGIGRGTDGIQTVNPYSDDEAVLRSVFAYTPCDYWTAGRIVADKKADDLASDGFGEIVRKLGDNNKMSGDSISAKECVKFAFCHKNDDSSSRMSVGAVNGIVDYFRSIISADANKKSWEEIFDDLPWFADLDPLKDESFKKFFGQTLGECPLYSIDRKFLYSYWRDCFANKQQLFLIFVRAESTALGGPGEGTPAQQGGRAVALVWREPTAYDEGSNPGSTYSDNIGQNDIRRREFRIGRRPHRMRVLFYHQFD